MLVAFLPRLHFQCWFHCWLHSCQEFTFKIFASSSSRCQELRIFSWLKLASQVIYTNPSSGSGNAKSQQVWTLYFTRCWGPSVSLNWSDFLGGVLPRACRWTLVDSNCHHEKGRVWAFHMYDKQQVSIDNYACLSRSRRTGLLCDTLLSTPCRGTLHAVNGL